MNGKGWRYMTEQRDTPYGMKVPQQILVTCKLIDDETIQVSESMMLYHKKLKYDTAFNTVEGGVMQHLSALFNIIPIARVALDHGRVGLIYDWSGGSDNDESTAVKIWKWFKDETAK
jgi:hypothetical protein